VAKVMGHNQFRLTDKVQSYDLREIFKSFSKPSFQKFLLKRIKKKILRLAKRALKFRSSGEAGEMAK